MKAQRCPVCRGSGVVRTETQTEGGGYVVATVPCHGCGGKGWVEVSEADECVIVPRLEETVQEETDQEVVEEKEETDEDE